MEAKIRELEQRLRTAQVAGDSAVPKDMVFLGATVRLRDTATGKMQRYRLREMAARERRRSAGGNPA